jgi:hypothetical protein
MLMLLTRVLARSITAPQLAPDVQCRQSTRFHASLAVSVEYALTDEGRDLAEVVTVFSTRAYEHMDAVEQARAAFAVCEAPAAQSWR